MLIHLDFETYSEGDLKTGGVWKYSVHPSTEVICLAYSIDGDPPLLWTPEDPTPAFARSPTAQLHAWNSFFEYCIWHNVLKWPAVPIERWTDTAALAAALALPRSLAGCGAAMGLPQDQQKDKHGQNLILRLCKPYRGARGRDKTALKELYDYCKQDVIAEQAIAAKLPPLKPKERRIWELDQKMNLKGVPIDIGNVQHAIFLANEVAQKLNEKIAEITEGEFDSTNRIAALKKYIEDKTGYTLKTFDKQYLENVLQDDNLPQIAREIILVRTQTGKTSAAKFEAMNKSADGGRLRGLFMYHGANTGRWAGRLVQPQNLLRPTIEDTDTCIDLFKYRDSELMIMLYDNPVSAISSCVRGLIRASEGKRLISADYAAIEARVLAWLAGQEEVLNVFRTHGKLYEHTASAIFKKPLESITKDQRQIGKVAALALGYQGGFKAFGNMAKIYGLSITDEGAENIKKQWRSANPNIVQYWWDCETAALNAVRNAGTAYTVRNVVFKKAGSFLYIKLPSGRLLAYPKPRIVAGGMKDEQLEFSGVEPIKKTWGARKTYAGKLVENITQAVARDLMAEAMLRLDAAGYELVMTVHDEIVAEVDKNFGSVKDFEKIMCEVPDWAKGLPLAAEGYESERYRK